MWIAVKSHRNNSASLIIQHHQLKELESQIIHKTLPWRAWGCLQPWWRPRWRKLRSLRPPAEYEYEDEDNRVGDDDEDKEDKDDGSFIVHLPIFFWVGFRWDCHYGPEMGGMDPKPRPTKPRDFLTHHYFQNGKFKITLNSCVNNGEETFQPSYIQLGPGNLARELVLARVVIMSAEFLSAQEVKF